MATDGRHDRQMSETKTNRANPMNDMRGKDGSTR